GDHDTVGPRRLLLPFVWKGPTHGHPASSAHAPGPPTRRPRRGDSEGLPPRRQAARRTLPQASRSGLRARIPRLPPLPQELIEDLISRSRDQVLGSRSPRPARQPLALWEMVRRGEGIVE